MNIAGLAGAGLVSGVAGFTAVNRAAVRRFTRRPDPVTWAELEMPADVADHRLTMSDRRELHAVERGPACGPPVLLLHGITLGAAVWPYQLAGLADAGFRVVALDQRGHGGSGGAVAGAETGTGAPLFTLGRMAADVAEVLDILDLEDATLVGHSMGGMVALELFAARPDLAAGGGRLAALVLAGTTANVTRRRGVPGLGDAVAAVAPLLTSASGLAARLPGPTLPANDLAFLLARITFGEDSSPTKVSFTGQLTSQVPVHVSAELLLEILRFNREDVLPGIKLPTTVVVGDQDIMTPPPQARHLARHIEGAELKVLERCGHMLMLERPDDLNRLIAVRAAG
jgi:pimeloyl-ACP methyl ester carboxylesterase